MNQLQMLKMALIAYVNSVKAVWSKLAYPLSIISKRKGNLKDYRIYGNTVQEGTLLDIQRTTSDTYLNDSGVETQSVGSCLSDYISVISGLTYYAVSTNEIGSTLTLRVNFFDSEKVWVSQSKYSIGSGTRTFEWVIPEGISYIRISYNRAAIPRVYTDLSPDNPMEVQSVGELTKNLWSGENYIISDSNSRSCATYLYPNGNPWVVSGTTITVSATVCVKDARTNTRMNVQVRLADGTAPDMKVSWFNSYGDEVRVSVTYTIPHYDVEIQRLEIRFVDYSDNPSGVWDAYVKDIQIEYGDTAAPYEPYNKYKIGVIARGKNIYKPTRISAVGINKSSSVAYLSNNYGTTISTTDATKGEFTVTQTKATGSYVTDYRNGYFVIETGESGLVEGKTYTLSFDCEILDSLVDTNTIGIMPNGGSGSSGTVVNGRVSVNFIYTLISGKDNYIEFRNAGKSLKISNLMITDTESNIDYEPYREPQTSNIFLDEPLRKIGEYEDVIDFEKGVVFRNIGKTEYTGTESWQVHASKNLLHYKGNISVPEGVSPSKSSIMSTHLPGRSWNSLYNNYYKAEGALSPGVALSHNTTYKERYVYACPFSTSITVNEWKALLQQWYEEGNPFTVFYAKSTTQELIDLPSLPQFKGTTVYEVDTTIKASGIKVCYYN